MAMTAFGYAFASEVWANCDDPFGAPGEPLDFHIKITHADWSVLVASRVASTDGNRAACDDKYPEFPAEFRCGDTGAWLKVAIRKKRGEERGVEAPQKPPLKIDINEDFMGKVPEAKGQRWPAAFGDFGYRKLTLNNGQGNKAPGRVLMLPNLLSEHVAMRLLRREVPSSPGSAIANVTLHFEGGETEFHGAYVLIEDIDKGALRRRFGRADGRLVKASKAGCPSEVEFDDGPPNEAKAAYDAFMAKSPAAFAGKWLTEAENGLDLDTALRQEAIREILVNGDDTLFFAGGEGNNWYSYDPRQGKRHFMPWDVDLTFGQQQQHCAPTALKCPPSTPLLRFCSSFRSRLGSVTACNAEIQKRYLAIMCQLTQGSLSADEILKVWDEADRAARPGVGREKDLIWRGMDPLSTAADKSYGAEYVRLRTWIPERIRSVQQQITAKGIACAPGCPAGAREACQYLTCAGERRCENNLWTPCTPAPTCTLPGPARPNPSASTGDAGVPDSGVSGGADAAFGTGGAGGAMANAGSGGTAGMGPPPAEGAGGQGAGSAGSGGSGGGRGASKGGTSGSTPTTGGGEAGGCSYGSPGANGGVGLIAAAILFCLVSPHRRRTREHSSPRPAKAGRGRRA